MDSGKTPRDRHEVDFSVHFSRIFIMLPANDARFISDFVTAVETNGLDNMQGRLKSSCDIPTDDPQWREKVQFVQKWNLWHYHIGLPTYDTTNGHGDYTSRWYLHLRRHTPEYTTIVDWDFHPPFELPKAGYLLRPGEKEEE